MLVPISIGLLLIFGMYKYGYSLPGLTNSVTSYLQERISNGVQFRDITFNTMKDNLNHPDVKNNAFAFSPDKKTDLGIFGLPREFKQLFSGTSEITELYRDTNLIL